MNVKRIVGTGDKIIGLTIPFALVIIVLNILYPQYFQLHSGLVGIIIGTTFLIIGIPFWFVSVVQILIYIPKNKLITKGPFSILLHPIYTSVAIFVIPGIGFIFDTWAGLGIGAILYIISRFFRVQEEKALHSIFSEEYRTYRSKVILPWL